MVSGPQFKSKNGGAIKQAIKVRWALPKWATWPIRPNIRKIKIKNRYFTDLSLKIFKIPKKKKTKNQCIKINNK